MLLSYLKVALRSFRRNKLVSFINVFGLGLSLTVAMMIMIRLQDQLSYDSFHPDSENIYRITSSYLKKSGEHWNMASTPIPLAAELTKKSGTLMTVTSIYPAFGGKANAEGKELQLNGAFTDNSFFDVLGFRLASGNPATALTEPNSVVITAGTAQRYFGTKHAIGKRFSLEKLGDYVVTGILEETGSKSHISFDAFASDAGVRKLESAGQLPEKTRDWFGFNNTYTYVRLTKQTDRKQLMNELGSVAKQVNFKNKSGITEFSAQPISGITPGTERLANEIGNGSSWTKFYFEIGIALVILLSACFNYTNLSIARALTRAREVGIRKVTGASRWQVFRQYILESAVTAFFALLFAWVVLAIIIRFAPFNDEYEFLPSTFRYNLPLVGASVGFALFTGLLAGISPALVLSSFTPLRVLKNMSTAKIMGRVNVRKALIVFQYSLSMVIIIFLVAFYRQFSYMSAEDPGYKRSEVMVVSLKGSDEEKAANEIKNLPGVTGTGLSSASFTKRFNGGRTVGWTGNPEDGQQINYYFADPEFIKIMGFEFISGQNFPGAASTVEEYIILNQQAVHALGLGAYQDAPGKLISINDSTRLMVQGVVRDFNYENVGIPVRPLALRSRKTAFTELYINTVPNTDPLLKSKVADVLKSMNPSLTFEPVWLDDEINKGNSQSATISLLGYLAFMAMAIATLGLLGLVMYTVEVKRKEISIRKIVGAREIQLIQILSRSFIWLLLIAGIIAVPVGYIASILFLQNFSVRTGFGPAWPLACFSILLVIGLITIISQTFKAAIQNPAHQLRAE
ncbi:MAG: FtsX-like permease family protein [Chitinophagaceae bacterium]|nr:MAG: FtsX-like permease family protein [Chitinophagaceae bacterium]